MRPTLHIVETECKSILNKETRGPGSYTLNAYQGCAFGCSYCYVPVIRRRRGQDDEHAWGTWVLVKMNAPDVLRRQMLGVPGDARIMIGTATDSWQPVEKRYGISRRILEELAYYPNHVSILTRSPLLIRDIDVLQRMPDVSVGVSLPTFDEQARRVFEPHAPSVAGRSALVRRLGAAGVRTTLFWIPILFGVTDTASGAREYLRQAADLGVARVACGTMNYTAVLGGPHIRLLREYRGRTGRPFVRSLDRAALSGEIARWAAHYGLECSL